MHEYACVNMNVGRIIPICNKKVLNTMIIESLFQWQIVKDNIIVVKMINPFNKDLKDRNPDQKVKMINF